MRRRRAALLTLLALLLAGLVALAWWSGASARELLLFVGIVAIAAWGAGARTRATISVEATVPAEAVASDVAEGMPLDDLPLEEPRH